MKGMKKRRKKIRNMWVTFIIILFCALSYERESIKYLIVSAWGKTMCTNVFLSVYLGRREITIKLKGKKKNIQANKMFCIKKDDDDDSKVKSKIAVWSWLKYVWAPNYDDAREYVRLFSK